MQNLNEIVSCFLMQSNSITQDEANTILIDLSNKEDFYLNSLNIFYSDESSISTKFFAIQVLKNAIQKKWVCMRPSFQDEVRSFVCSYFFENPFHKETPIDGLVFQLVFSILFYEWPEKWSNFFTDLIDIENSEITTILALKFMAFIGYETQSNLLTSVRTYIISHSLESKIPAIFQFIQTLLTKNEISKEIVIASFKFLTSCIPWISADLFVESTFFSQLAENYFENTELTEVIIPFLTELVTSLDLPPDKQGIISQIFNILTSINGKVSNPFHFVSAIKAIYDFYSQVVEVRDNIGQYKETLDFILRITSEADDFENPELLEICLSFWAKIFQRCTTDNSPITSNLYMPFSSPILEILYSKIPPPYLIVTHIDELDIEHSTMENSQYHSNIYSSIKQSLNHLISLNENSVIDFFFEKISLLQSHIEKGDFNESSSIENDSFNEIKYNINQLSWMIFSAAGTFSEAQDESRLPLLITSLLELTKNSRPYTVINAIISVFQYPKILRKFPDKLNFLTQRIFEFLMNNTNETEYLVIYLLKTCSNEIKQLMIQQELFNYLILISEPLKEKISDDCLIELYSVFGNFLKEISDKKQKEEILQLILQLPSITSASDINLNKELSLCLKCHTSLQNKIALDYFDFLKEFNFDQLFLTYSNELRQQLQAKEKNQNEIVSSIALVKSNIVNLITQFVTFCLQPQIVNGFILPTFCNLFFNDFTDSPNEARSFHTIKFAHSLLLRSDIPVSTIFNSILSPTFSMISQNFDDFKEFRLPFYSLITVVINHHFDFLMEMKMNDLDDFIHILMYGSSHPMSSISQLSLKLLSSFVKNIKDTPRFEEVFTQYCVEIVKLAFSILSDLFLKSDFEEIAALIKSIFSYQEEIPKFVPEIVEGLVSILPMVNPSDLVELVKSLIDCGSYLEGMRILLKDFTIQLGQFISANKEMAGTADSESISILIREYFGKHEVITEEFAAELQLSEGMKSVTINPH